MTSSSSNGEDLLVGWDSNGNLNQEEEEEKSPLKESSADTLEGGNNSNNNKNNNSHESEEPKRTRRWGIGRIPKEDDSSGDYYDEGEGEGVVNDNGSGNGNDDSIFSSKSYDDHCLDSRMNRDGCDDSCDDFNDSNNGTSDKRDRDDNKECNEENNESESNELSTIINSQREEQQQQQQQQTQTQGPKGIWGRISGLTIKQNEKESEGNTGLLKDNPMNHSNIGSDNDTRGNEGSKTNKEEELNIDNDDDNDPPDKSIDDILVRRLSTNSNSKTLPQAMNNKDRTQKSLLRDGNNGTDAESEKETFEMKNPIEGFGSNQLQSHQNNNNNNNNSNNTSASTSTNPIKSGINSFFQAIQLRRIKARHEFDPFSLTEEELEILKQDILRRQDDFEMEQMKVDGEKSKPKDTLKKSIQNIQSAVLAPEAFSAYYDRKVDEAATEDSMGYYRNVALGGEADIYDDYELRQKKMKPMKMEGDDPTWGDIVEELCDPDGFVIDETTYLEDDDPLGVYRGLPAKCDSDDDSVDVAKETNNMKDNKETEKLRGEIKSLTEKVQNLVRQLHAKEEETQKWRKKALDLEKDLEELKRKDIADNEDVDLF